MAVLPTIQTSATWARLTPACSVNSPSRLSSVSLDHCRQGMASIRVAPGIRQATDDILAVADLWI